MDRAEAEAEAEAVFVKRVRMPHERDNAMLLRLCAVAAGGVFARASWESFWAERAPDPVSPWQEDAASIAPVTEPLDGSTFSPDDATITVGTGFACMLVSGPGSGLRCWGAAPRGAGGVDPSTTGSAPAAAGATTFEQASAAGDHVCGLHRAGVTCWGGRFDGAHIDVTGAIQVTAGESCVCALRANGSVTCIGACVTRAR